MTVFQVPTSSGAPISMQSLMGAAISRANQAQQYTNTIGQQNNGMRNQLVQQGNQYRYNRALVNQRTSAYLQRQQNADSILRARNADQSMATYDVGQQMFPNSMPVIPDATLQNIPPQALRQFTGYATVAIPAETRRGGQFVQTAAPMVSPNMRSVAQGALNTSVGKTANYIQQAPTPGGYEAAPVPGQRYQRVSSQQVAGTPVDISQQFNPQVTHPSTQYQYGSTGARVQSSPPVDPNNPAPPQDRTQMQPAVGGSQPLQGGASMDVQVNPYSPAPTNYTGSPLVDQGSVDDIQRALQLEHSSKAMGIANNSGGEALTDFNGQPIKYRSGRVVPNSIETEAKSQEYAAMLQGGKTGTDINSLQKWNSDIAEGVQAFKQTANAFRTIQDAMLANPDTSGQTQKAMATARAQLDKDYQQWVNVYNTQGEQAARSYTGTLVNNLQRGFTNAFQFLPAANQGDAKTRQAFAMGTGMMALQISKVLNGGKPTEPDTQKVIQSMGSAMDDPNTMFTKQSGFLNYLSSHVGSRVLATRDPRMINEFNDSYHAVTGADYDPRGPLYEGINNEVPRSNQPEYAPPVQQPQYVPQAQPQQPTGAWPYAAQGQQQASAPPSSTRSGMYDVDEAQQIQQLLDF